MPSTAPGPAGDGLLEVGRIGRAHGVRGALVVTLTSDRRERVAPGSRLFDGQQWLVVETARPQPQHRWVVHFDGLADRNAAEALSGRVLWAEPVADDEAMWVHDLIGASVVDRDGVVPRRRASPSSTTRPTTSSSSTPATWSRSSSSPEPPTE